MTGRDEKTGACPGGSNDMTTYSYLAMAIGALALAVLVTS